MVERLRSLSARFRKKAEADDRLRAERFAAAAELTDAPLTVTVRELERHLAIARANGYMVGHWDGTERLPFDPDQAAVLDALNADIGLPGGTWQLIGRE